MSSSLIDTRNSYAAHQFLRYGEYLNILKFGPYGFLLFRKSTNREEGWLEIDFSDKSYNITNWRECWVVFECMEADGGVLHIHLDRNSEAILSVPISSVLSCKADVSYFRHMNRIIFLYIVNLNFFQNASRCIKLQTTGDQRLNLRASDSEEVI